MLFSSECRTDQFDQICLLVPFDVRSAQRLSDRASLETAASERRFEFVRKSVVHGIGVNLRVRDHAAIRTDLQLDPAPREARFAAECERKLLPE